jgi:hypothetical protein
VAAPRWVGSTPGRSVAGFWRFRSSHRARLVPPGAGNAAIEEGSASKSPGMRKLITVALLVAALAPAGVGKAGAGTARPEARGTPCSYTSHSLRGALTVVQVTAAVFSRVASRVCRMVREALRLPRPVRDMGLSVFGPPRCTARLLGTTVRLNVRTLMPGQARRACSSVAVLLGGKKKWKWVNWPR